MNTHNRTKSSIIYVNFAPYENTGKILDYLLTTFQYVVLFSFNFHHLGKRSSQNKLIVYFKGKIINSKNLLDFQVPEALIFLLLPIRSLFIFIQLLFYTAYLRAKYGKFYYYLSVNAFTSWTGNILKKIGFVERTIYWVYDYFPPFHKSKVIAFMRVLYWQFDKLATKSDTLIFLNNRVANLRKEIGILTSNQKYKIIPIGTTNMANMGAGKLNSNRKIKLVYLGVVKKDQGLDLIFDCSEKIISSFPNIEIDLIGAGPDLGYFKKRGTNSKLKINYHGYLLEKDIDKIFKKAHIGIATYIPSDKNVSFYGDPSKIKRYLSFNLPVITTNTFEFSKEIKKLNAGILIKYESDDLINAIKKIINKYNHYKKGAKKLSHKYYYKKLYPKMFTPYQDSSQ